MKGTTTYVAIIMIMTIAIRVDGQTSVFSLIQDREKQGDKYFEEKNYKAAAESYRAATGGTDVALKLARALFHARDYEEAALTFASIVSRSGNKIPVADLTLFAETQSILQNYTAARQYLEQAVVREPNNDMIAKKLWQLNNLQFMYEDSAHYSVQPLSINSGASELCAVPLANRIVFTSNRKATRPIDQVAANETALLYKLYTVGRQKDSATSTYITDGRPMRFAASIQNNFHIGPAAFFNHGQQMVFAASASTTSSEGRRSMGLYFGSLAGDKWKTDLSYPYNSDDYSIADVTINEEGMVLYFSAEMKGGFGGKDIYKSSFADGHWSKPVNAGEAINTSGDEVFPYLHRNATLYFSSGGHSGIGGLDLFKSAILPDGYSEPENLGYPMNSSLDDFAIALDSGATHGYFTSNRKNGGADDDLYEFDMDLQTYPFEITGVLRFKEHTWSNEKNIHVWSDAKMTLVDSWRDAEIATITTDGNGAFSIPIPYFSRYHLLVSTPQGTQYMASLELGKYRTSNYVYDIVVVKDIFTDKDLK